MLHILTLSNAIFSNTIIKTTTTRWHNRRTQLCGRSIHDFGLCVENKSLTYLPTNLGIRTRVLAEPYLSPQCCMGWIGQDSGKGIELQGKIMPKAWEKSLHRLNQTTKCDPYSFKA